MSRSEVQAPVKIPWRVPDIVDCEASLCEIYERSKKQLRSLKKRIAKLEEKRDRKQAKLNTICLQHELVITSDSDSCARHA